jgi:PKD domain-containing protein
VQLPTLGRARAGAAHTADLGPLDVPADALGTALVATVDWGDGSPAEPATLAGGRLGGTHTYARAGRYRVTVRLVDRYGGAQLGTADQQLIVTGR